MKERIEQIIRAKNLTATEFALRLGIQPSNVSHLLAGRNNPSLEFVKKLKETFPEYNLDWIVFGKGPVTISEPFKEKMPIQESAVELKKGKNEQLPVDDFANTLFDTRNLEVSSTVDNQQETKKSPLKSIILVYQDDSFEVLQPKMV